MNISGIAQAIRARIIADTGSGGVWETAGTYKAKTASYAQGPRAANAAALQALCPYIVYDVVSGDSGEDCFTSDVLLTTWEVNVWDDINNTTSGAEGALRGSGIIDRLYGDGIPQSTRAPTYGFHRHQLTLTTTGHASAPWATGLVAIQRLDRAHEADFYHWTLTMNVLMSRVRT